MPKRKYYLTLKKLENRFKEKRGTGSGSKYIPWVNIHDFPSCGRSTRLLGIKTNRIHQYSDYAVNIIKDMNANVDKDIMYRGQKDRLLWNKIDTNTYKVHF